MKIRKLTAVMLIIIMLTSCSKAPESSETGNGTQNTSADIAQSFVGTEDIRVWKETKNAEEHFFFDGIELGTKYTDMGKVINPDGIFGDLAYEDWNGEEWNNYTGSVSINESSCARTTENDIVYGDLFFGRTYYYDGISLLGMKVTLTMDETQPDTEEFLQEKDELYRKFLKELGITSMETLDGDIPASDMEGYLYEGYEQKLLEGYVYDDTQTRTKYHFVASYCTKDNPNEAKGEKKIIARIEFSKESYPEEYTLKTN